MQILAAKIDRHDRLAILADRRPETGDLTYTAYPYDWPGPYGTQRRQVGTLYLATDPSSGYVNFLFETDDPTGFYGAVFTLPLSDGTVREVTGPWSGSPDPVHELVPTISIYTGRSVSLYEDTHSYDAASGGWAAYLTTEAARDALTLAAAPDPQPHAEKHQPGSRWAWLARFLRPAR